MKRFFKRKQDPLLKALLLAESSIQLVYDYAGQSPHPLGKKDLEKIAHLMKVYHRNFISAEYIHRHECIRANRNEDLETIDYRFQ